MAMEVPYMAVRVCCFMGLSYSRENSLLPVLKEPLFLSHGLQLTWAWEGSVFLGRSVIESVWYPTESLGGLKKRT
jgi:hypothetical protein